MPAAVWRGWFCHELFPCVYVATGTPDLSRVTDMSGMFEDATLFNGDISS